RKGMNENSPIKTREYLAAGLPVIIGYDDIDFPDRPDYILQLPNSEDNVVIHIEAIRAFVRRVKGTRVPREIVQPRIDAAGKEATRLAFMRQCLVTSQSSGRRPGGDP
ncbi:MAG: hypothetical protein IMZ44_14030, partial [Planctomycetes bacterium]|nr:hypothetical protein [Planctomycetota bacterium]